MQRDLKSPSFRIGGMTCVNCQNRIEKKLKSTLGIEDAVVAFTTGIACVTYDESVIRFTEITQAIEQLGYSVLDMQRTAPRSGPSPTEIAGTLVIILALYVLLRGLGMSTLTSSFPLAEAGMGYGLLFVIGLITSVHCVAMCGGINLSQCIPGTVATLQERRRWNVLFPSILYNAGRVISYTTLGIMVGALGQVFTVSGRLQGALQLIAGVFMVIMGITMLGIFPALRRFTLRMPNIFARKLDEQKTSTKSPLMIGLLNGLMPCGPLQAMQLYALSTGSPIAGGISMFLFSMGTVPLMFGIGALSSVLSTQFTHRVMKGGAILVTVMGMTMFTYGWGLSGFSFDGTLAAFAVQRPASSKRGGPETGFMPVIENGVQIVTSTLSGGRYPAITVQQGIPVKWTINAPQGSINGCNNRMIIREYQVEHRFKPGENVITFTPERTGTFSYSCWMGMIRSAITVLAEGAGALVEAEPDLSPVPAGVVIPTEQAAVAEIKEGYQAVRIRLKDDGIEPALIIVQRAVPALWTISNDSLDPGNSSLIFPAYYTQVEMAIGDNVIQLMPTEDFDFSTADHVFYGYVKVVEDLNILDMEAIQAEVADFETLIYPEAYFEEAAAQGTGCCGGSGSATVSLSDNPPQEIRVSLETGIMVLAAFALLWGIARSAKGCLKPLRGSGQGDPKL
ncbi:MAG: sulfite exporter TauE/SafE family protein [Treponema sp.]|jgi:sulfite exporter TauE/SafE/copper chaperone CopZ/plastocyanin domain-containing protein|nr:sulfite exporter TauE/SafE family protein [Treponema sp.]